MTALATAADTATACLPFSFESNQVRVAVNGDGNPWFVAKDVCAALDISWTSRTLDPIPSEWKRLIKISNPGLWGDETHHPKKKGGLRGALTFISEPAVYKLAFRSNKPEADRFTNKVASEVIPALRRTGKYEVCPTPTTAPSRLTTAKERNALTGLVNRYVGLLPGGPNQESYKAAWRRVHDVMGIGAIEELTVEQLPRAVMFMQSMVEALAKPEAVPALPAPRTRNTLGDYCALYRNLPPSPQYWDALLTRYLQAHEVMGRELEAIKAEATKPFRVGRKSGVATYFDEAMSPMYSLFDAAEKNQHHAYCNVFDALNGCRHIWLLLHKG